MSSLDPNNAPQWLSMSVEEFLRQRAMQEDSKAVAAAAGKDKNSKQVFFGALTIKFFVTVGGEAVLFENTRSKAICVPEEHITIKPEMEYDFFVKPRPRFLRQPFHQLIIDHFAPSIANGIFEGFQLDYRREGFAELSLYELDEKHSQYKLMGLRIGIIVSLHADCHIKPGQTFWFTSRTKGRYPLRATTGLQDASEDETILLFQRLGIDISIMIPDPIEAINNLEGKRQYCQNQARSILAAWRWQTKEFGQLHGLLIRNYHDPEEFTNITLYSKTTYDKMAGSEHVTNDQGTHEWIVVGHLTENGDVAITTKSMDVLDSMILPDDGRRLKCVVWDSRDG